MTKHSSQWDPLFIIYSFPNPGQCNLLNQNIGVLALAHGKGLVLGGDSLTQIGL